MKFQHQIISHRTDALVEDVTVEKDKNNTTRRYVKQVPCNQDAALNDLIGRLLNSYKIPYDLFTTARFKG